MTNKRIEKIMDRHIITSNDEACEAIGFVVELLEEELSQTMTEEPYATRSIADYETAIRIVDRLLDLVDEGE